MTRSSSWRRLTLLLFAISLAMPASSLAAPSSGLRDISKTAEGKSEAQAAAARYAKAGIAVLPDRLQVFRAADGDTFVLPQGTKPVLGGPSGRDVLGVRIGGPDRSSSAVTVGTAIAPTATSDWPIWTSNCFTRKNKTYGYMDTCFVLRRHDGNGTYDWFALHAYGTVWARSGNKVARAWVQSKPGGGSPTTWVDWDPSGTVNPAGACDTVTIGISIPVSLAYSHAMCEEWNIAKGAASGDFRTTWTTPTPITHPQSRRVAFLLDMRAAENAYPYWVISWDFGAP